MNPYFEAFTFRVTWIIESTVLLLSIEADNFWNELGDSFQLLPVSIERRGTVNSMIQVTRKVNADFAVFPFRVTWSIEFTLLLSIEPDNIWNELGGCFQVLSASLERRRRVNSMIRVRRKVNPYFELFTFHVT